VFSEARTDSPVVHTIEEEYLYTMHSVVSGFNDGEEYFYIGGHEPPDDENKYGKNPIRGYLLKVEENDK